MDKNKISKRNDFNLTVKAVGVENEEFVLDFIGSAESKDRHGDIVKSDGWMLDSYLKNPVFLWGHDSRGLPIGKAIDVKVNGEEKRLEFKIKFAVEEYPFAATVYKLYKNGFLNATSVGFIPHEGEYDGEKDAFVFTKNELLELSAVTVPANPDALRLGLSKGMFDNNEIKRMEEEGIIEEDEVTLVDGSPEVEEETTPKNVEVDDTENSDLVTTEEEQNTLETDTEDKSELTDPEAENDDIDDSEDNNESQELEFMELLVKISELKEDINIIKEQLINITKVMEAPKGDEINTSDKTEEQTTSDADEDSEEKFEEPQIITSETLKKLFASVKNN